jgi:hypothetical protein
MEGDFQSGKSINAKMKKRNKKKNGCIITRLWPSVEDMKKDLFIDLEKQEVTRLSTGHKYTLSLNGKNNHKYYKIHFCIKSKGCFLSAHRLFFYWHHGYLPKQIDHIDRIKLNNDVSNLRELNNSQNQHNRDKLKKRKGKKTSSKYKNVIWDKKSNKWRARVRLNYKLISLGFFDDEDEAGQAVNNFYLENNLYGIAVFNDTPQERARTLSLFDEPEPILNLK